MVPQHTGTAKGIIKFNIRYPFEYLEKTPNMEKLTNMKQQTI